MARTFASGSFQYLDNDHGVQLDGLTTTMFAWFRVSSLPGARQAIMSVMDPSGTSSNDVMSLEIDSSGNIIADIEQRAATTTAAAGTNTWHNGLALFHASNSRKAYIDGGDVGVNTVGRTSATMDIFTVGARNLAAGNDRFFDGDIGEWALWGVSLTIDEIEALGRGASPALIQPQNIICYGHGFGTGNQELVIGPTMTDNGTVTDAGSHPPVFLPTQPFAVLPAAADIVLDAQPGAVILAGVAASLEVGYRLDAQPGAVVIAGTTANLKVGYRLDAQPGAVVIAGTAATLTVGIILDAQPGAVVLIGTAASLEIGYRLDAQSGAVVIVGTAATLTYSRTEPFLPQVTPGTLPPVGWDGTADVVVEDTDDLQVAVDNADVSSGMYIIELTSGDSWTGEIQIDNSVATGVNWLVFRNSNFANLPAEGDRLQPSPANDADMAIIIGSTLSGEGHNCLGVYGSDDQSGGAAKVAFIGIEFHPPVAVQSNYNLQVSVGRFFQAGLTDTDDFCNDVTFYQCRFKAGSPLQPVEHGLRNYACNDFIISCSDFENYDSTVADGAGGFRMYGGVGTRVYNNGFNTESIGIFLSDTNASSHNEVPTDVTIDHNYNWRDIAARPGFHKNCFELKAVERLLVENNIFHTSWKGAGSQNGYGVKIANTHTHSLDITYRYNIVHDVNQGYLIQGNSGSAGDMRRVSYHDNLLYNIDALYGTGDNGDDRNARAGEHTSPSFDVKVLRNTFVCSDGQGKNNLFLAAGGKSERQIWRDNVVANTTSAARFSYRAAGGRDDVEALNFSCNEYTLEYTALMGADIDDYDDSGIVDSGSVVDNNFFPTAQSEFNFLNATDDDYRIQSGTYLTASSTGGVLGADIDEINARTANVVTGTFGKFLPYFAREMNDTLIRM